MDIQETKSYNCKVNVTLRSTIPVVGCEINPSVSVTSKGPFPVPFHSYSVNFKWYKEAEICSIHNDKLATVQCVSCVKLNIPGKESYHCSTKCFLNSWQAHQQRHHLETERRTLTDDAQTIRKLRSSGSWPELCSECLIDEAAMMDGGGKDWFLVSCSRSYVPEVDDLGLILKLDCVAVDLLTNTALSELNQTMTDPVIEFPEAQPRPMVPTPRVQESSSLCSTSLNDFTFSILSYNILSDIYTYQKYYNCPPWALVWEYRRHNLLREIIKYNADIICLQEVQSDHFENFFKPKLTEEGYMAIYKKKNNEVYTGNQFVTDGCATFYRRHLFKEFAKHEVEFNKKTSPVVEALEPDLRSEASKHLMKDNVALVVILETLGNCCIKDAIQSRICVVNAHICSDPKLPDVKLFQVVTLVNELEKMLQSEIPLLICGDFNSVPQSDPYTFMVTGKLEHSESVDPYGVYQHLKLVHRFLLASAYASFGLAVAMQERQLGKFNQETREPELTFRSKRFSKTLDYIFYTVNTLEVEAVLELLDHEDVAAGLPSPLWSSDHIALMSSFRILPKKQSCN
ncbi:carbon catabolite repressor protein 4 homolog 1-like isoform X2 [Prosopis cineraria]|uniref:carbon catabolite repressor protein 4 homolog 1-like isoform X2 n=1 Tax=Prosopis cineraria TaxID=364024 RepID=UPI002410484D|nr:carbon catabolite repressor protein 4 homolog 1-like isoform X2 [Prosopis cineraria]